MMGTCEGEGESGDRSEPAPPLPAPGPALFIDRTLSLIEFERRVFDEARDDSTPLLERVKFLEILGTNIEQFIMNRGRRLQRASAARETVIRDHRMLSAAPIDKILNEFVGLMREARRHFQSHIVPALAASGIHILRYENLTAEERTSVDKYFARSILPVLTPLAFGPDQPFPHFENRGLDLALVLRNRDEVDCFAYVKIPQNLPALVPVHSKRNTGRRQPPSEIGKFREGFVWLEQVIIANLAALFPGMKILEVNRFQVFRDAELSIKERSSRNDGPLR